MNRQNKHVIIVGGGASGFFAAINLAEQRADIRITILEKSNKVLSKVKVSGGGRCNVTHQPHPIPQFSKNYPRGQKQLVQLLKVFGPQDTIAWFKQKGICLKTEADGRMFPITDRSETIIQCFMKLARLHHINILLSQQVTNISKADTGQFVVKIKGQSSIRATQVILATGGYPHLKSYEWIGLPSNCIEKPVPSLFTFNAPDSPLKKLAGISMPDALVKISGTKFQFQGPLLLTHWGFSGPAVLKLSAFAARTLESLEYKFQIRINWNGSEDAESYNNKIKALKVESPQKQVINAPVIQLPQRLWEAILLMANIEPNRKWIDMGKKQINTLVEKLFNATFEIREKTTFKEEFVTAGGIKMSEINLKRMESNSISGLYYAGELVNFDGITGGFNFQNAWTTAYIVSQSIAQSI